MSTAEQLAKLETDGKLFRFAPKLRHGLKRRLYLTSEANRNFNDPNSATNFLPRPRGMIEAAMVRWVAGDRVFTDDRWKPRFLKELDPPPCSDIWEIRVTEPTPNVRLIGAFLERDTLILSRFRTRTLLGKRGSQAWQDAMNGCTTDFTNLFQRPPMHGQVLGEYISENYDEFTLNR